MKAFVAVADARGFAPAAQRLGMSPSVVTRLVARLRSQLGIRLLQRTTRSVTLTDAGARYLERARRVLSELEEAEESASAERARPTGRLVVSAPAMFGRLHVGPLMCRYLNMNPDVVGELTLFRPDGQPRRGRYRSRGAHRAPRGLVADRAPRGRNPPGARRVAVLSRTARRARHAAELARHQTIQFSPLATAADWSFREATVSCASRSPRTMRPTARTPRSGTPSTMVGLPFGFDVPGRRRSESRPPAHRARDLRASSAADSFRISVLAPAVRKSARVCGTRRGHLRLAVLNDATDRAVHKA